MGDHFIRYEFAHIPPVVALISLNRVKWYYVNIYILFALDVSDVSVLDTLSFQADEILQILRKTDVESQLRKRKSEGGSARSKFNLQQILNTHENANDDQICSLLLKENRSTKCSKLRCKNIKVEGTLTVPYDKEIPLKQFHFCARKVCFTTTPVWSNVRRPVDI